MQPDNNPAEGQFLEQSSPAVPETPVYTPPQPEPPATEAPALVQPANQPVQPMAEQPSTPPGPVHQSMHEPSQPETLHPGAQFQPVAAIAQAAPAGAPAAPAFTYLTGSQLEPVKEKIPKGVYLIAGVNLLGFILYFFNTYEDSLLFLIAAFIDLLLAAGLLLKLEVARKIIIWFALLMVGLNIFLLFLLFGLQNKVNSDYAAYKADVSKVNMNTLPLGEKAYLNQQEANIQALQKTETKEMKLAYIYTALYAVAGAGTVIYLNRRGVKSIFRELPE
jgi:hypothetical protein